MQGHKYMLYFSHNYKSTMHELDNTGMKTEGKYETRKLVKFESYEAHEKEEKRG